NFSTGLEVRHSTHRQHALVDQLPSHGTDRGRGDVDMVISGMPHGAFRHQMKKHIGTGKLLCEFREGEHRSPGLLHRLSTGRMKPTDQVATGWCRIAQKL